MSSAESPQQACADDCDVTSVGLNPIFWPTAGNLRHQCSAALNTDATYHSGLNNGFVPNGCMDPGAGFPLASEGTDAFQLGGAATATLNGGSGTFVPINGGFFDVTAPNTSCSSTETTCPTQINQVEVRFADFTLDGHNVGGLTLELDEQVLTASGVQVGNLFIFTIPAGVTFDSRATIDGHLTGLSVTSTQEVDGGINTTDGAGVFQFDVTGKFDGKTLEVSGVATSSVVTATAPVVTAGTVTVTDSTTSCTANVTLTASASSAAGLPVSISYLVDDTLIGTGSSVTTTMTIGTEHDVNIQGVDTNGMQDTVTETVTPTDNLPPTITIANDGSGYAVTQWPPNGRYVSHSLADCVVGPLVDNCDGSVDINSVGKILRITSDEPENALGDGSTCNDIVITSPSTFQLRSERSGTGDGRVYTIEFSVTDKAGNTEVETCSIQVPPNRSTAATAEAPVYCVGADCGSLPGNDPNCRSGMRSGLLH